MNTENPEIPKGPQAHDIEVDLLVVGSGTGMAAALAAAELGLRALVIEKSAYVGGSTAKSGGMFWVPNNATLVESGAADSLERATEYLDAVVGDDAPRERRLAFVEHGPAAIDMLERTCPMTFMWDKGYSDYHPENPGGSAAGRSCECLPVDAALLGEDRPMLHPGPVDMGMPVPVPATGADYKWLNLMTKKPLPAIQRVMKAGIKGVGGMLQKKEFVAGGQALGAGMWAGLKRAGVPVWTRTALVRLLVDDDGRVRGGVVEQDGVEYQVTADKGVVLAAGGFDHDMEWRRRYQSESLSEDLSLGTETNTGDAIRLAMELGADTGLMDQSWWFPAIAPVGDSGVQMMLAERSLPGSFMVNQHGRRFINEAMEYMDFGKRVLALEKAGEPVGDMWIVFDQTYRNNYMFAITLFARMPIPKQWFEEGVAVTSHSPRELAQQMGVPVDAFVDQFEEFNQMAAAGIDGRYHRGDSAYDRYYGDPTVQPNPNLRPLSGKLYAVRVVLSDLGTCGGLRADARARVLRADGSVIPGLYAIGNTAANAFGKTYPGAGATVGQGLVFGYLAARDAAGVAG